MVAEAFAVDVAMLAAPRGWCAGVERAVEMVNQELEQGPLHLRHAIVARSPPVSPATTLRCWRS